jgi:hypothetical protein
MIIVVAAAAVLARLIRAVAWTRVGMGRLGRMRILVVGVIIRRGTLKTDTFIMLRRGALPSCVIRLSSRRIGSIRVRRRRISMGRRRRVAVLRLAVQSGGS